MRPATPRRLAAMFAGLLLFGQHIGPALAAAAPADDGHVLIREAPSGQASWRLLVVPGSGCASLAPSLGRMFAWAPSAQVHLLQKPWLGHAECSLQFLQNDRLSRWRDLALTLAQATLERSDARLPLLLVGLSEGAEILPDLARAFPDARMLVIVGNAGLDPVVTGSLQAVRNGVLDRWEQIFEAAEADGPAERLIEGRSAGYWRDLRTWPLQVPLMQDLRPLIHAWGGEDALVPAEAYDRFQQQAEQTRPATYCALRFAQSDHQLRGPAGDRLQSLWRALEAMLRRPSSDVAVCGALRATAGLAP